MKLFSGHDHSKAAGLLLAACALWCLSCGSDSNLSGDTTQDSPIDPVADETPGDPVLDVAQDELQDPVTDDVPPGPGITFVLGFITDIPMDEFLYAQTSSESCTLGWIGVIGGAGAVPLQSDCSICSCDECTGCAVCGMCMVAAERLASGDDVRYDWDGVVHERDTCQASPTGPSLSCENATSLEPGEYTARFCFGIGDENAYPDDIISDPICHDVTFTYPVPGGVVQYVLNNGG